jgi:hypothetical protein
MDAFADLEEQNLEAAAFGEPVQEVKKVIYCYLSIGYNK